MATYTIDAGYFGVFATGRRIEGPTPSEDDKYKVRLLESNEDTDVIPPIVTELKNLDGRAPDLYVGVSEGRQVLFVFDTDGNRMVGALNPPNKTAVFSATTN